MQVTYRYKTQVPEEAQRRVEGIKVKRKFPAKIPVSKRRLTISASLTRVSHGATIDSRDSILSLLSMVPLPGVM